MKSPICFFIFLPFSFNRLVALYDLQLLVFSTLTHFNSNLCSPRSAYAPTTPGTSSSSSSCSPVQVHSSRPPLHCKGSLSFCLRGQLGCCCGTPTPAICLTSPSISTFFFFSNARISSGQLDGSRECGLVLCYHSAFASSLKSHSSSMAVIRWGEEAQSKPSGCIYDFLWEEVSSHRPHLCRKHARTTNMANTPSQATSPSFWVAGVQISCCCSHTHAHAHTNNCHKVFPVMRKRSCASQHGHTIIMGFRNP